MKNNNYNSSGEGSISDLHILGKDDYITLFENKKNKTKKKFKLFGNR